MPNDIPATSTLANMSNDTNTSIDTPALSGPRKINITSNDMPTLSELRSTDMSNDMPAPSKPRNTNITSNDIPALFEAGDIPALFSALERLKPPSDPPATADSVPSNTLVAARIRPFSSAELDASEPEAVCLMGSHHVRTRYLRRGVLGAPPSLESAVFNVDTVFEAEAETQEVYDALVKSKLEFVRQHKDSAATLFAHGQTGSGKTHTMTGLQDMLATELLGEEWKKEWRVGVSVVELAGNAACGRAPLFAPFQCHHEVLTIKISYRTAHRSTSAKTDAAMSTSSSPRSCSRTPQTR